MFKEILKKNSFLSLEDPSLYFGKWALIQGTFEEIQRGNFDVEDGDCELEDLDENNWYSESKKTKSILKTPLIITEIRKTGEFLDFDRWFPETDFDWHGPDHLNFGVGDNKVDYDGFWRFHLERNGQLYVLAEQSEWMYRTEDDMWLVDYLKLSDENTMIRTQDVIHDGVYRSQFTYVFKRITSRNTPSNFIKRLTEQVLSILDYDNFEQAQSGVLELRERHKNIVEGIIVSEKGYFSDAIEDSHKDLQKLVRTLNKKFDWTQSPTCSKFIKKLYSSINYLLRLHQQNFSEDPPQILQKAVSLINEGQAQEVLSWSKENFHKYRIKKYAKWLHLQITISQIIASIKLQNSQDLEASRNKLLGNTVDFLMIKAFFAWIADTYQYPESDSSSLSTLKSWFPRLSKKEKLDYIKLYQSSFLDNLFEMGISLLQDRAKEPVIRFVRHLWHIMSTDEEVDSEILEKLFMLQYERKELSDWRDLSLFEGICSDSSCEFLANMFIEFIEGGILTDKDEVRWAFWSIERLLKRIGMIHRIEDLLKKMMVKYKSDRGTLSQLKELRQELEG